MCDDLLSKEDVVKILRDAVEKEDTQANFAAKHYFAASTVSFILTGKNLPGPSILNALGLEKVIMYRRKNDIQKED